MKKFNIILVISIIACVLFIGACGADNEQPQNITLSKSDVDLFVGDTYQLYASVSPTTSDQSVVWSSANTSYATVDNNGLVKCLEQGTTVITAQTKNGLVATCTVSVSLAIGAVKGYVTYMNITVDKVDSVDANATVQLISKNIEQFPNKYLLSTNTVGIYSTVVDSLGNYEFSDIPVGEYRLIFESSHAKRPAEGVLAMVRGEDDDAALKRIYGDSLYAKLVKADRVSFLRTVLSQYMVYGVDVTVENGKTLTINKSIVGW